MKKLFIQIFLTALLLAIGAGVETLTIIGVNVHDDLLSIASLLASFAVILLMLLGIYQIWLTNINQLKNPKPQTNEPN